MQSTSVSKMKAISVLLFAGVVALACGYSITGDNLVKGDQTVLDKQARMLQVLQHVHQPYLQPKLLDIAQKWSIEKNFDKYTNVEAIKEFWQLYQHGDFLPMNEVFSLYNTQHREQAIALFHLFYYAKDFETFYQSLVWARFNLNEGQFVYALTVAVIHRNDMEGLELPAIYEIFPHYFFSSEVIERAQKYVETGFYDVKKVGEDYVVVIPANYTGHENFANAEQRISYFTEDIGLNAYYYYFQADYPFWFGGLNANLYKDRRGEFYLFNHQQLLARYYLERLSNGLGAIHDVNYWEPLKTGYYPNLRYYNGLPFTPRDNNHVVYQEDVYHEVDEIAVLESRIMNAIDHGYITLQDGKLINITKPEGIDYLGNLIQGNPDSLNLRFYKYLYQVIRVLSRSFGQDHVHHHSIIPSVLEHHETQLRDPVFWQLYKRIVMWYWRFKDTLPAYKLDEIKFDGVRITSVEADKLTTYFERFDADITNAVNIEMPTEERMSEIRKFGRISHFHGRDLVIKARQYRLAHLPFKLNMNIESNKAQKSVIRVYLGPKYDENGHKLTVNENRENFYLLDIFAKDLVSGMNNIVRDSTEFAYTVKDRTTYVELYKWVMNAFNKKQDWTMDNTEAHSGFPNRLVLPKGQKGGQKFALFVHVSPFHAPEVAQYSGYNHIISTGVGSGARWVDSLPFGYPLDRKINEAYWYTSNMMYTDVLIYHKKETEVN